MTIRESEIGHNPEGAKITGFGIVSLPFEACDVADYQLGEG